MNPNSPRSPDAYDSLRVLGVVLLGISGLWFLLMEMKPGLGPTVLAIEGLFLLVPVGYAALFRLPLVSSFALRPPSVRALFCILLASLSSMWLLNGLTIIQDFILIQVGLEQYARNTIDQLQKPVLDVLSRGLLPAILMMSVLPGLCEEVLFRGIVFRGFQKSFSPLAALLVTAVLFALMHQVWLKMIPMFFLGLFFGTLVLLSRSLWAGVIAHMANNGAVLVVAKVESGGHQVSQAPWFVYPFAGVLFLLAMMALYRSYQQGDPGSGTDAENPSGPVTTASHGDS